MSVLLKVYIIFCCPIPNFADHGGALLVMKTKCNYIHIHTNMDLEVAFSTKWSNAYCWLCMSHAPDPGCPFFVFCCCCVITLNFTFFHLCTFAKNPHFQRNTLLRVKEIAMLRFISSRYTVWHLTWTLLAPHFSLQTKNGENVCFRPRVYQLG